MTTGIDFLAAGMNGHVVRLGIGCKEVGKSWGNPKKDI
jgi:hypothetical protein